jgi:hypothetical protein
MLSNYIKVTDKEIAEGTQEVNLGYSPHNIFIIPFQKKPMSATSEPAKSEPAKSEPAVNAIAPINKKTICLGMIVKNEAQIIIQTLTQLTSFINFDYWVINDNGSTDGTQELIRTFFKEKGIPGELDETEWRDFAYNRTVVFDRAYNKTDYIFVWDADDTIHGNFTFPSDELLIYDNYYFIFGNDSGFRWNRFQLFNNHLHWKYIGILHEYPSCKESNKELSTYTVNGDYYFVGRTIGNRSNDSEKYKKDGILLENAFKEAYEKGDEIYGRYAFYAAQSYKDCGMCEKALEYYKKVLSLNNWNQEKYVSCLEIYTLYESMGQEESGLFYLIESFKYHSKRVECIYRLVKYYCIKGMHEVAYAYYTLIKDYYENEYENDENISGYLFMRKSEYDFYLPYYMIIVSERLKIYDTYSKMYEIIFNKRVLNIGTWWINYLYNNIQFGIDKFPQTEEFLKSMIAYVNSYDKDIENRKFIKCVLSYYKHVLNMDCGSI